MTPSTSATTTQPKMTTPLTAVPGSASMVMAMNTRESASVTPSTSCSISTVPAMVGIGTSWPSCTSRRLSTTMRPTSPMRAISTVLSRKPTKMAGTIWR